MSEIIQIYFDGASKNNPGEAGAGWHITAPSLQYAVKGYEYLGPKKTNNQAEYTGLRNALRQVVKDIKNLSSYTVQVQGDSQLAMKQLNKEYKVKSENLLELYNEVDQIVAKIPNITFEWIPRIQNKIADAMANMAIQTKGTNYKF